METVINGQRRPVEITYKRMKNIVLRVSAEGVIQISCPRHVTHAQIESFIREKETWILKAERSQSRRSNSVKTGTDMKEATWLGKTYPVRFEKSAHDAMLFEGDEIVFCLRECNAESIENAFYREAAKQLTVMIQERRDEWDTNICLASHKKMPRITLKYMTSRWGSCTPARSHISMSLRLIHFPPQCLDYVLLHEYAHILVPNHSKAFHDLVASYMPDWKEANALLK